MKLSPRELAAVQLQLSMASVQKYDRKTVWLLVRHIEQQDEELKEAAKSADFLQDAVIKLLKKKNPPLWKRIFRRG